MNLPVIALLLMLFCRDTVHVQAQAQSNFTEQQKSMEVILKGRIFPSRFLNVSGEPFGHHAIVWKGGMAASRALISAESSDLVVAEKMVALGYKGENNLTPETWDHRKDEKDPAADERVEGSPVEVEIAWEGSQGYHNLAEVLGLDRTDFRFGDHRSLIPVWHSGCIVCNVSCPGGKISNHSLTIRDQAKGRLKSLIHLLANLPRDGTPVLIKILPHDRKP